MTEEPSEENGCFAVAEEELNSLIASPAAFRKWLHRRLFKPWGVGYAGDKDMCPLAAWLHETTQDYSIKVRKDCVTWQSGEMPLSSWMRGFVHLIDQSAAEGEWVVIQAGEAICSLSVAECFAEDAALPVAAPVLEPALAV